MKTAGSILATSIRERAQDAGWPARKASGSLAGHPSKPRPARPLVMPAHWLDSRRREQAPAGTGAPAPTLALRASDPDSPPALPLIEQLDLLASVLATLSADQYTASAVGAIAGSVGGHVRHCLDHVTAFLSGYRCGKIDYDRRERGTEVERERTAALSLMRDLRQRLTRVSAHGLQRPLRVVSLLSPGLRPMETLSTVGRELAFTVSHTIHHGAIIAALARTQGAAVPALFGYAPATIAHLEPPAPCAP